VFSPQRKALFRAYQHVYERLTLPSPVLRHYTVSYDWSVVSAGSGGVAAAIGHVAGIHTTYGLVLAALDASLPAARVTQTMERLAKALRRDHYRLLLPSPGAVS
jgi:hypothetical protein